jgi:hypothetical protein
MNGLNESNDEFGEDTEGIREISDGILSLATNENKPNNCPYVEICLGHDKINVLFDSGSQISLITEEIYENLKSRGYPILTLSAKAAILVTAIGKMSGKLHKQAMVEYEIGGYKFNHVFLVAPHLTVPMITRADFLDDDKINLSFKDRSLQADRDGVIIKYRFNGEDGQGTAGHNEKNPCDDSEYIGTYTTNTLELIADLIKSNRGHVFSRTRIERFITILTSSSVTLILPALVYIANWSSSLGCINLMLLANRYISASNEVCLCSSHFHRALFRNNGNNGAT